MNLKNNHTTNFILGRSIPRSIPLRKVFNRPDMLMEANMIDDLLRGLTMMPMETLDSSVTKEVTNHLFETTRPKSGIFQRSTDGYF